MAESFAERVRSRDLTVGVVGLGYVGLPLAMAYAEAGFRTVGFDVDAERTRALGEGTSHIEDVPHERVQAGVGSGRFEPTSDPGRLFTADAVFICVPTPFDAAKTPDLTYIKAAADAVSRTLHAGMLVVLQSTTYPGTTTEVVQPVLERCGLKAGQDFHLAFSPERVDPGNTTWTVRNTPKVVGGLTAECGERARLLLESVMDDEGSVHVLSSTATAEMTKLLENTYRAVNIAMVNELAILSREMGIDVWEVIDAASTKPFGFQAFRPGIGPGGHCIPVDPYYLAWRAREFDFQTKFIELAADTNQRMAHYVRGRIIDFCNDLGRSLNGARVLVQGASFKPSVGDVRNSRAIRLMELLEERGARVDFLDPYVDEATIGGTRRKSLAEAEVDLAAYDLSVICVAHPEMDLAGLLDSGLPVFDAVGATLGRPEAPGRLERL
jgi:UDP-N-acetyl-D-glucosamine dehydrogenase